MLDHAAGRLHSRQRPGDAAVALALDRRRERGRVQRGVVGHRVAYGSDERVPVLDNGPVVDRVDAAGPAHHAVHLSKPLFGAARHVALDHQPEAARRPQAAVRAGDHAQRVEGLPRRDPVQVDVRGAPCAAPEHIGREVVCFQEELPRLVKEGRDAPGRLAGDVSGAVAHVRGQTVAVAAPQVQHCERQCLHCRFRGAPFIINLCLNVYTRSII
eukprot:2524260-Prymnesium_polylepis.1